MSLPNAYLRRRAGSPDGRTGVADALSAIDNTRITEIRPLLPPMLLHDECPLPAQAAATVAMARAQVARIVTGADDRLLVVVGPCSIHDVTVAREYAARLHAYAAAAAADLMVVMRVYFEKPRTTVGWKGLINDPKLDGSFAINAGLRLARQLLVDINAMLPCAGECLDTLSPQFLADCYAWAAIGARTTASQVHRELASGLSMPVGFKNDTMGDVGVAADAVRAAAHPHHFLSVTKQGLAAIVATSGNEHCHVILRGGSRGPNFAEPAVRDAVATLRARGVRARLMIDASHGNSAKDYRRQHGVVEEIARQVEGSAETSEYIMGVMIESNLVEGRQDLRSDGGLEGLVYGQSITDACIGWDETVQCLDRLRAAVQKRRATKAASLSNEEDAE